MGREWLKAFTYGIKEHGEFFEEDNSKWFRYMAPLIAEPDCLKCHAKHGYQEGEVRGGISVSLPYPIQPHTDFVVTFSLVSIVGLIFIFIGGNLYERKKLLFDATFNNTVPTCVTDTDYTILLANDSYRNEFGSLSKDKKTIKCYEHRPGKSCHTEQCPLTRILGGAKVCISEPSKEKDGIYNDFIVTAKPLFDSRGKVAGIVESFQKITERKKMEAEREHLISELEKSLEQVKLLKGFIPICASCKKVRDDQGFWSQVESYITKHSEAQFSHGICPDCAKKLYPGVDIEKLIGQ